MRRKAWALLVTTALVTTLFATAAVAANPWESADIRGQGMSGPLVADDGAKIRRTASGVTASVTMPTPEPGSYVYPQGPTASGVEGHPEAFSLWVFIFFNPEECASAVCGPGDLANPDVIGAGYNAGGHLAAGSKLTISGVVNAQSRAFGPPGVPVCTVGGAGVCVETIGQALDMDDIAIAGAEIHLAVAPHGALAADLLPAQIGTPVGTPAHWWIALFN